jgi:hypothetical protein
MGHLTEELFLQPVDPLLVDVAWSRQVSEI